MKANHRFRDAIQLSLMLIISMCTQVLSLLKSSILASHFGVGSEIDAYNLTFSVVTFIFSFVGTGITTVLIPAYIRNEKDEAVDSFLTLIYMICMTASICLMLFQQPIFYLFSSKSVEFMSTISKILPILLFSQFTNAYLGVTTAYFQCKDKYNIPKLCLFFSTLALVVLMFIDKNLTVIRLSYYTAIAAFLNFLIQYLLGKYYGMHNKLRINFYSKEFRMMVRIFLPTVFSAGLYQFNLLMDSIISSRIGTGNVTILTYSNSLIAMINSLIMANLITFFYPKISRAVSEKNGNERKVLVNYINIMNHLNALLLIGFALLGKDFLRILLVHGKFTEDNLNITFICTCIYMLGFPFDSARDAIYRFFYANNNTKTIFYNSVVASCVNFTVSIILSNFIGIFGVVIGTLVSQIVSLSMVSAKYNRIFNWEGYGKIILLLSIKIFIPVLILCSLAFFAQGLFLTNFLSRVISGIIIILFVLIIIVYRLKQLLFEDVTG